MKMKVRKTETTITNHEASTPALPVPVQKKFVTARNELAAAMVERDTEIDLVLTALICKEHPLLVGPPGTGKSHLLDNLMSWIDGAQSFTVLFNKFTTPEEVFGPISVNGLKSDVYRRITTGRLPEAHLAFADEIFKASSAILNTLLKILNERSYEVGDGSTRKVPLIMCLAASNEWPNDSGDGKELCALLDRFLFRKKVKPVSLIAGRKALLKRAVEGNTCRPTFSLPITPEEIEVAHQEAMKLPISNEAKKALWTLLEELTKEGIIPGDRRIYKAVGAIRAFAYLRGAAEVQPIHLEILAHVLWDDPQEQPEKCAKIVARIANPTGHKINELLIQIEDVASKVTDKLTATTAVPKLQEIQQQLEKLPDGEQKERALSVCTEAVKEAYNKVIGFTPKS